MLTSWPVGDTQSFVITIGGPDEAGLMVSICETLEQLDCELADSRMTRLGSRFSGLVVAHAPVSLTRERLSEGFAALRERGCRVSCVTHDGSVIGHQPTMRGWMISYQASAAPAALRALAETMGQLGCEFVDISVETRLGLEKTIVVACEMDAPASVARHVIQDTAKASLARYGIAASIFPTNMDDVASGEWPAVVDSQLD